MRRGLLLLAFALIGCPSPQETAKPGFDWTAYLTGQATFGVSKASAPPPVQRQAVNTTDDHTHIIDPSNRRCLPAQPSPGGGVPATCMCYTPCSVPGCAFSQPSTGTGSECAGTAGEAATTWPDECLKGNHDWGDEECGAKSEFKPGCMLWMCVRHCARCRTSGRSRWADDPPGCSGLAR